MGKGGNDDAGGAPGGIFTCWLIMMILGITWLGQYNTPRAYNLQAQETWKDATCKVIYRDWLKMEYTEGDSKATYYKVKHRVTVRPADGGNPYNATAFRYPFWAYEYHKDARSGKVALFRRRREAFKFKNSKKRGETYNCHYNPDAKLRVAWHLEDEKAIKYFWIGLILFLVSIIPVVCLCCAVTWINVAGKFHLSDVFHREGETEEQRLERLGIPPGHALRGGNTVSASGTPTRARARMGVAVDTRAHALVRQVSLQGNIAMSRIRSFRSRDSASMEVDVEQEFAPAGVSAGTGPLDSAMKQFEDASTGSAAHDALRKLLTVVGEAAPEDVKARQLAPKLAAIRKAKTAALGQAFYDVWCKHIFAEVVNLVFAKTKEANEAPSAIVELEGEAHHL